MKKNPPMCGIAGIMVLNNVEKTILQRIEDCARAIAHRGPDNLSTTQFADIALSHSRLSIIDTSAAANQPLHDTAKEYTIVFNGEIFNYAEIRNELTHKGVNFQTQGDTEVFLELFKKEGLKALERISGFFAAAIYHHSTQKLYLFRDRYGVKPLYYYYNNHTFIFSSEVRGIRASGVSLTLCKEALHFYLQLNYIPGELSIYEEIKKIPAGHYAIICNDGIKCEPYYSLLSKLHSIHADENSIAQVLKNLLEKSVKDRLVADLPVGCFLSGGIDSTIVAGIAAREIPQLPTFSLGFKENSWFDESKYAELAARHFKTEHHTFSLTNHDLLEHFDDFLLAQDEPFADSSALNVFILSKKTKGFVKTVLSGDGADEIFGGYTKHRAEWLIQNDPLTRIFGRFGKFTATIFPASRNSSFGNKIRQWQKLSALTDLPAEERYWKMACISSEIEASSLLKSEFITDKFESTKSKFLESVRKNNNLNGVLLNDINLVLENDMLVKIDRMSMANGLEIRSPFMDYRVIEFGMNISENLKVNKKEGKFILKKAFTNLIPEELVHRKKRGFEVPLQQWMKKELKEKISGDLLEKRFIEEQGIFNYPAIKNLLEKAHSKNPGDSVARIWGLMMFNNWYKKMQT